MDEEVVREVVTRVSPAFLQQFGLNHWRIQVSYNTKPDDDGDSIVYGSCSASYDYNEAVINLNPKAFDSEKDVIETLRHELFHIIMSPYELFIQCVDSLDVGATSRKLLSRALTHSREKCVINLERMYRGLTEHDEPQTPP